MPGQPIRRWSRLITGGECHERKRNNEESRRGEPTPTSSRSSPRIPHRGGNRSGRRHQESDLYHGNQTLCWLRKTGSRAQPMDAFHAIIARPSKPSLKKVKSYGTTTSKRAVGNPSRQRGLRARTISLPLPPRPATSSLASPACPTCGAAPGINSGAATVPSYVYAIGRIEPRFPRPSVEKEFAQALGRNETAGLTDRQAFQNVLSQRQNRYLTRQMCWVMTIEGLETYILTPRDPVDLDLLVEALRPNPTPMDLDIVIGFKGPIAPPELCNGLMVPIVGFDQIYSFDRDALIKAIPKPEQVSAAAFAPAAADLFDRIMQLADNAGGTDEHRALNYLAVRYPAIYPRAAEDFARNASLTAGKVLLSPLSRTKKILDVIFSYTNRNTDVTEKFFVRVDVTELFPFLVTKLSPYYDR